MLKKSVLLAGIGRLGIPVVENLAAKGWRVAVSFRKGHNSEKTVKVLSTKLGKDSVLGFDTSISEPDQAQKFITSSLEYLGRIDALICIASGYPDEQLDWRRWEDGRGIEEKDWEFYNSNFFTALNTTLPLLDSINNPAKDLSIIFFSDTRSLLSMDQSVLDPYAEFGGITRLDLETVKKAGLKRLEGSAPRREINPYTLAKIDLAHLSWTLALKYQGGRTRINTIAPGPMLPPPDKSKEEAGGVIEQTLLKRWGGTEPIVRAVDFFLDDNFLNGEILRVDGGFNLKSRFRGK